MAEYVRQKSLNMPALTEHNRNTVAEMNNLFDFLILNALKGIMYVMETYSKTIMTYVPIFVSFVWINHNRPFEFPMLSDIMQIVRANIAIVSMPVYIRYVVVSDIEHYKCYEFISLIQDTLQKRNDREPGLIPGRDFYIALAVVKSINR